MAAYPMTPKTREELLALNGTTPLYGSTSQYIYDKVIEAAKNGKTEFSYVFDMMKIPELLNPPKNPRIIYPDPYVYIQKYCPEYTFRSLSLLFLDDSIKICMTHIMKNGEFCIKKTKGKREDAYVEIERNGMCDSVTEEYKIIYINWL